MKYRRVRGFVYLIKSLDLYKIGFCTCRWNIPKTYKKKLADERVEYGVFSDLRKRVDQYRVHNPHSVTLLAWTVTDDCMFLESQIHRKYETYRREGEWFALQDYQVQEIKKRHLEQSI